MAYDNFLFPESTSCSQSQLPVLSVCGLQFPVRGGGGLCDISVLLVGYPKLWLIVAKELVGGGEALEAWTTYFW